MVNPSKNNKNTVILTAEVTIAQWENLMKSHPHIVSELMALPELGDEARTGLSIFSDVIAQFIPNERMLKKIAA